MPLQAGNSKQVISSNIIELYKANKTKPNNKKRSRKQILAIAFSKARKSK